MMIAMDAEWGLAMRLDSTYAFPWNMTLGAIRQNKVIESVGRQIGKHCKRLGVHMNFATVVDINTNPDNPIIGNRSFGSDKINVTRCANAFLKGMTSEGVLSCLKHFPGHGDTATDSHKTLPTINFSAQRIDSVELYPYKNVKPEYFHSVMVAHLNIPSLEPKEGLPSTLSKAIVTDLLQEKLGYKGLIFTDALNMKGVANYSTPEKVGVLSLLAGNDILLMPKDVESIIAEVEKAVKRKRFRKRACRSVKKVLHAKYLAGLAAYKPISLTGLTDDLNRYENEIIYSNAIKGALTLLKNDNGLIPFKKLNKRKIGYVGLGKDNGDVFFFLI